MLESLFATNPPAESGPVERTSAEQARVDEETRSLVLYHYESCWFCARVRRVIGQLNLNVEKKDILQSAEHRQSLVNGGGHATVPCLRIREADGEERWLYDSAVIIDYLNERFGNNA